MVFSGWNHSPTLPNYQSCLFKAYPILVSFIIYGEGVHITTAILDRQLSWYPGSSAGKESACNAGDPGLIPGSGSSPGEGIGHPHQYSWASLVALVKNPPAMLETWVWSLGWENPLEEGMATYSSILAWRILMNRGGWQASPWSCEESDMTERLSTALS